MMITMMNPIIALSSCLVLSFLHSLSEVFMTVIPFGFVFMSCIGSCLFAVLLISVLLEASVGMDNLRASLWGKGSVLASVKRRCVGQVYDAAVNNSIS